MSDKRISQLVERTAIENNDVLPIVALGASSTNKVTITTIEDYMQANLDMGVTSIGISKTGDALAITGSPVTSAGTINIAFAGTSGQYVNGAGNLTTFPSLTGYVPYTGATADVDLGNYGLQADYLNVNVPSTHTPTVGDIVWNSIDGTFDMGLLNGVTLQAGQELHFYGKAQGTIDNGDAVMFAGVQGNHLLMSKADAATINANPQYFIGVATQDFANNEFGYVTVLGKVRGLNTTGYTLGSVLYYNSTSATDGLLTETMPTAPNAKIEVAAVVRVHGTQGILMVRPHVMPKMQDIQDVNISSIADNQLLAWSTNRFENKSISTILGYTPANDSLVVHLAGTETITGAKTFSQDITVNSVNVGKGAGSGAHNVAIGDNVLTDNTTGNANIGIGTFPLWHNTTGFGNIAIGREALIASQTGSLNIAIGDNTMKGIVTGGQNIAIGANVAQSATSGSNNLMIGYSAATMLTTGANNLFLGYGAGSTITTGNYNTIIGGFPSFSSAGSLSNNVIIADGQGNIRFQWNGSQTLISGTPLGSNAFTSTSYLPLTGGTLTGALSGTSATFSGNLTINTNKFFVNATTGNVGIGTSSPSGALHISGSTYASSRIYLQRTSGAVGTYSMGVQNENNAFGITDEGQGNLTRFYINGSGNVGIGTNSPNVSGQGANARVLTVQGVSGTYGGVEVGASGSLSAPALQGYYGFTNTAITGGLLAYIGANLEGTNGSATMGCTMTFNTKPDGGSVTERMRITPGGTLSVNSISPNTDAVLYTKGRTSGGDGYSAIFVNSSGTTMLALRNDGVTTAQGIYNYNYASTANVFVQTDGVLGRNSSSLKYKKNIEDYTKGLEYVLKLRPVLYESRNPTEDSLKFTGFIAEEVSGIGLTELVHYDNNEPDSLHYPHFVALLTKAIQEQQAQIEELKAKIK